MDRRRRRRLSAVLRGLWAVLLWGTLLVASVLLALPTLLPYVLPRLAARAGVELSLERASYALPGPGLRLQGLRLGPAEVGPRAGDLWLTLDPGELLQGRVRLARVVLEGGQAALGPGEDGGVTVLGLAPAARDLAALVPERLEASDVALGLDGFGLPAARLLRLSLTRAAGGGPGGRYEGVLALALGDAEVRVNGEAVTSERGLEVGGEIELARLDVARLGALKPAALAALSVGRVEGTARVQRLFLRPSGQISAVVAESVDVKGVGLALEVPGVSLREGRGGFQGRIELDASEGGGAGRVGLAGVASLEGAWLTVTLEGESQTFALEGAGFHGRASSDDAGGWSFDGDATLARAEGLDGALDGAQGRGVAAWGLRRSPGGGVAAGQITAEQVTVGPAAGSTGALAGVRAVQADAVAVRGLARAGDGLVFDRLSAGPVTVAYRDRPELRVAVLEATEGALAPGWARVQTLSLEGAAESAVQGAPGLRAVRAGFVGLRSEAGEPLHLGEVRLGGIELALVRGPSGDWRLPTLPPVGPAGVTLDALLVDRGSRVALTDRSVSPPTQLALEEVEGRVGGRDARGPGRFAASGRVAGGGRLTLSGELGPRTADGRARVQAELAEVPLATVSPYVENAVGVGVAGGTLAGRFDLTATGVGLRGQARLTLAGARVRTAEETSRARWLGNALAALEAPGGLVRLELPVGGEGPGDRLRSALRAAVEVVYRPVGLAPEGVDTLLWQGVAGTSEVAVSAEGRPDPGGAAALERLAAVLRAHPRAAAVLCHGPLDRGLGGGTPPLPGPPAWPAGRGVWDTLVAGQGIAPERALVCPAPIPEGEEVETVTLGVAVRPPAPAGSP